MYENKTYITHDTVEASLDTGDLEQSCDTDDVDFDLDEERVVTVNNPPWQNAFDTDQFYVADATVARPIEQTYFYDGDEKTFKKPAEELKKSAWSLDNKPFTLGHPESGRVKGVNDVRGFWRSPSYDEDANDLNAELYVPINDDDALRHISENQDVSVGFSHRLSASEEDGIDAYQVDLYYDHVAGVERGRCPSEKGCGINKKVTELENDTFVQLDAAVGDFVKGNSSGGTWHGKVVERKTEGCFSERIDGDQEICAEDDDPVLLIENYDDETGEGTGTMVAHKESSVDMWDYSSDDSDNLSDLDLTPPQSVQDAAQKALDWKDEYDVDAMTETGWSRARQLADGEELSPADISDGTDGMSNWWARHEEDFDIESEYEDEPWKDNGYVAGLGWGGESGMKWAMRMDKKITDIRESTDGYTITPSNGASYGADDGKIGIHVENDYRDENDKYYALSPEEGMGEPKYPIANCSDASDAWKLRGHGDYRVSQDTLEERIKRRASELDCSDMPWMDDDSEESNDSNTGNTNMTDDCTCNDDGDGDTDVSFDASSFALDYIAERNDEVAQVVEERDEYETQVDELETQVDEKEEKIDELQDELDEYRQDEKDGIVEDITDITSTWDEDELRDLGLDELRDRLEVAKDIAEETGVANATTETVDKSPTEGNGLRDPLDNFNSVR